MSYLILVGIIFRGTKSVEMCLHAGLSCVAGQDAPRRAGRGDLDTDLQSWNHPSRRLKFHNVSVSIDS